MKANKRELGKGWLMVAALIALSVTLSALVFSLRVLPEFGIIIYKEQYLAFFLTLCLLLTFILIPARQRKDRVERTVPWYDLLLMIAALAAGGYLSLNYHNLVGQIGVLTADKIVASVVGITLLLEAVRRHSGWSMVCVCLLSLVYAYFGNHLSGVFETRVIRSDRLFVYTFLGEGAVLGLPLAVAATIVTAFVLFGQMLFHVGGGNAISDFAFALMGRRRGGPAKVSTFASALFGSLSGSASANVATTGMLTIPMMKKVGYSAEKAGAIEAVASTGGLILPPIMGATGFLMAEFLGMPYSEVALAALFPALLFYLCVYIQVDLEAGRSGLASIDATELPALKNALVAVLPTLIPFAVLIYVLFGMSWSAEGAAFISTAATVLLSLALPSMRSSFSGYLKVLISTGEAVVFISVMCAAAGLVVGVLGLTGLGANLSQNLVELSGGNVVLLLVFAAMGSIILGMGVPVTATYIILVVLIGPALVQVGINGLAAHLFVFYFGTLSFLTPPVCLSVFVAASLANASPISTAFYSMRLAVVAYLIPFVFVFNPAFLLEGGAGNVFNAIVGSVIGVFLLSAGLVGFFVRRMGVVSRLVALAGGLFCLWLGSSSWPLAVLALAVLGGLYLSQGGRGFRRRTKHSVSESGGAAGPEIS